MTQARRADNSMCEQSVMLATIVLEILVGTQDLEGYYVLES